MKTEEILTALRRLKVETGSLACMGCGREHDCGIHGCQIVREAAKLIEKLTDRCAHYAEEIAVLQERQKKRQLMTNMERKTFCAALRCYGGQAQITMVFEEMAELQNALCKFLRGHIDGDTLANIAEDIADVGIMLDQMAIEFKVEDAVAEQRAFKVRRLRSRIGYPEQED